MKLKLFYLAAIVCCVSFTASAQDALVNSLNANKSEKAKEKFTFAPVINLECTSVKNQGSSGTCWSYSGNSFFESEMIRMGKAPVDIAEIYTARNVYIEKAKNYIQMNGAISWGDGGELHDVINMYGKYGALPQEAYTGLRFGAKSNKFTEMQDVLKAMLDAFLKKGNGKLSPNWLETFTAVLDSYLGPVPEKFDYKGKTYTPQSFAKEVVGLNAGDYIEMQSTTTAPYYQKAFLAVPDNWSFDLAYNIPVNDITTVIDYALKNGYTVGWATDVSEKYFSWKNGVAYVPATPVEDMTEKDLKELFDGPKKEAEITPEMRQQGLDNLATTDDHGMQISGLYKDQTGREYYLVKNSWGESNDYKGYLYVTKNYVKLKTTGLMVHKGGIPKEIKSKMGL